jgi:hypothetical protein
MNDERIHEGEEFRVTFVSSPDDFNSILDNPELIDAQFFREFQDRMIDEQGAYLSEISSQEPRLLDTGSLEFVRVYRVDSLLPPYLSGSSTTSFVAPIAWLPISVVVGLLLGIIGGMAAGAMILSEPIKMAVEKLSAEQITDAIEEGADVVKTLAIGLVIALIIAKVA